MGFWCRVAVGLGLVVGVGAAWGQQGQKSCSVVDENGNTVVWPDCKPPAETTPAAPGGQTPAGPAASGSAPAATPPADANDLPVSKRFPFPGEQPATDAPPAGGAQPAAGGTGGLQDAGSSGSASSSSSSGDPDSSSSSSSSEGGEGGAVGPLADDDEAAKAAAARKSARHKLPPVSRQSPDEREQEDLKVAEFYMDDHNYRGAYARATDAVGIAADDAEAHFALAEAARKLGKLDEAETHYKKCLTLDPVPKTKKAAEKALKEMSGGG